MPGGLGALHGIGNVAVAVLFVIGWALRVSDPGHPGAAPVNLSLTGVLLALVTGRLGGELVERLGIGVDQGAPAGTNGLGFASVRSLIGWRAHWPGRRFS